MEPRDAESNYVVSMVAPLPEADAFDAAGGIAPRLGLERDRLARLLSRRPGPITRPLDREHAERIAAMLESAGVAVEIEPLEPPDPAPSLDAWMGFDAERDRMAYDADWRHDEAEVAAAASMPEMPRPYEPPDVPQVRREPRWEEPPDFDWNQPIGFARWRRPVLLAFLIAAMGIFVWLQVALSPTPGAQGPSGAYDRGLAAYRTGDFGRAMSAWESAANEGDARALFMLGYMSEFGQGQAWSNRRAAEYYRQAAERGSVRAQVALGSLYERGLGVPFSERTAVRWYALAAENGHPEAQYRLGLALLEGRGVERDWLAALRWFASAAEAGVREAEAFQSVLQAVPQTSLAEPPAEF